MFTTLNNEIAKHIVMCAVMQKHRFCAYSLYNHYKANSFNELTFRRLFKVVVELLEHYTVMMVDDSIDFHVRDFIYRYYGNNFSNY